MRWTDRVYGDATIDDPGVLAVINCPTFRRLEGIKQAGPSAVAFPFKTVTRFEHSLGVYLLLGRLGAGRRERVAGLLHDVSHTAFSHAVDFVVASDEQDHHERLKPEFLDRPDLAAALAALGFAPAEFYDDAIYPLLERPLPWLCADRLDYFFRDGLACGVATPAVVARLLGRLVVVGETIAFADLASAREAADLFAVMNRDWWASPTEAYIYNEFADRPPRGVPAAGRSASPTCWPTTPTSGPAWRRSGSPRIARGTGPHPALPAGTRGRVRPAGSPPRSAGWTRPCATGRPAGGSRSSERERGGPAFTDSAGIGITSPPFRVMRPRKTRLGEFTL